MKSSETYLICVFIIIIIVIVFRDYIIEKFSSIYPIHTDEVINIKPIRYVANPIDSYVQNQSADTLDRYYNPMRYPYQKTELYYPNMTLPPQVIGCGARTTPCVGGPQIPVIATSNMLNLSNSAIAPINIRTRGPEGMPQQVGTIFRLRSVHSEVLPLFGRKEYPNGSNNWEYYTIAGDHNVKLKIVSRRKGEQLGTNDIVYIRGYNRFQYRVTMYDYDFMKYIPY